MNIGIIVATQAELNDLAERYAEGMQQVYTSTKRTYSTDNKQRIYSTKGIAITLSAYGGGVFAKTGGYLINGKPRKLHPRECARIMGYPDSYKICKSANQAYKQFGNSVVIDVLQLIAVEIGIVLRDK